MNTLEAPLPEPAFGQAPPLADILEGLPDLNLDVQEEVCVFSAEV